MLELFYTCVKCTLNTKNPLLPPQKSVKVDLIQENTGSFTTKKLLFSYEKYENAYAKRGVTVNPTIYDVSRLSGVSIATVSRAFSNPERVREDTRRKVFEAAEVLHYSPNAIARAMARQRTDKIAFLICKEGATILDEFYAGICTGIMRETNRSDFELVISTAADWDTASNTSKNKQVEGVILGGNARPDMIAELQNRDLAVVLVNNRIQGLDIPCVVSDEYGGVRQALEHLIGRGHRNIAMLAGRFSPYILGERYRAFLEVTQAHGLPADTRHIKLCDPTVESAAEACLELLSRQDRPTAIFGGNDVMAAGAMKAALRLGLRAPVDPYFGKIQNAAGARREFCHAQKRGGEDMKARKRAGTVGKVLGCALLLVIALFPIYWLVAMAIRPTSEMQGHISLIPQSLTIEHFISLFVSKGFGQAAINSLQTTLSSLVLSLIVGICAAYILARRRFRFGLKRPMTYWVLLVRVLPPVAFTIPLYTMFSKIGLLNTKIPVTLACVLINVPLIIWFLISFFQDLPEEVEESAKVDGATEWQLFRKIVLPLVAPGIAAVAMLSFMYAWNEYTYTVICTRSPSNYTVPLALSVLNTEDNLTNFGLVAAGGVVSVIPITLFVIFAQNYLISGLSSGAVKE